jgi:putative transposase
MPPDDYIGKRRYFLTFVTKSRHRRFVDATVVDCCGSQILRSAKQTGFAILTSCYMPDHLHLVVEGTGEESDLLQFAKLAKQLSGFHVKQQYGFQLWEPGFFDRFIREAEDLSSRIEYVRQNPVRAGLVVKPEDYPFLFETPAPD